MPRLTELPPKALGLIATTGFAAAGVVAVVAENLRTLTAGDEPLPERAKEVGRNSLGAVLDGPSGLSERGRSLVGRDGGNGRAADADVGPRSPRPTEAGGADTSAAAARDGEAVPPRGIDTSSPDAAPDTAKPSSRAQGEEPGAGEDERAERKEQAKEAARRAADNAARAEDAAERAETTKPTGTTKRTGTAKQADRGEQKQAVDVPAGVEEGLVADLQRMTVKQLRERAAQDGVAGRSGMSKDELVTALATRETEDMPAKG